MTDTLNDPSPWRVIATGERLLVGGAQLTLYDRSEVVYDPRPDQPVPEYATMLPETIGTRLQLAGGRVIRLVAVGRWRDDDAEDDEPDLDIELFAYLVARWKGLVLTD